MFGTLHRYHLPDPVPDITGEHYRNSEDLYGTPTSEKHHTSLTEGGSKPHGLPFRLNARYANNVSMTMQCCECLKPRVIYAQHKLRLQDELCLQGLLTAVVYSCESQLSDLTAEDSSLLHKDFLSHVFV